MRKGGMSTGRRAEGMNRGSKQIDTPLSASNDTRTRNGRNADPQMQHGTLVLDAAREGQGMPIVKVS